MNCVGKTISNFNHTDSSVHSSSLSGNILRNSFVFLCVSVPTEDLILFKVSQLSKPPTTNEIEKNYCSNNRPV